MQFFLKKVQFPLFRSVFWPADSFLAGINYPGIPEPVLRWIKHLFTTIFFLLFSKFMPHPHSLRIAECFISKWENENREFGIILSSSPVRQRRRPVQFHLEEISLLNILTNKIAYCSFIYSKKYFNYSKKSA